MGWVAFNTLFSVFIRLSFRALAGISLHVQLIVRFTVFMDGVTSIILFFVVGLFGASKTFIVFENWLIF